MGYGRVTASFSPPQPQTALSALLPRALVALLAGPTMSQPRPWLSVTFRSWKVQFTLSFQPQFFPLSGCRGEARGSSLCSHFIFLLPSCEGTSWLGAGGSMMRGEVLLWSGPQRPAVGVARSLVHPWCARISLAHLCGHPGNCTPCLSPAGPSPCRQCCWWGSLSRGSSPGLFWASLLIWALRALQHFLCSEFPRGLGRHLGCI